MRAKSEGNESDEVGSGRESRYFRVFVTLLHDRSLLIPCHCPQRPVIARSFPITLARRASLFPSLSYEYYEFVVCIVRWSFSRKKYLSLTSTLKNIDFEHGEADGSRINLKKFRVFDKPVTRGEWRDSHRFSNDSPLIFGFIVSFRAICTRCFKSLAINIGMASARVTILIYQACCATDLFPYISNSDTVYVSVQ